MAYKVHPKQPPKRDTGFAWDDVAPGLYDDGEVLVELDGIHAALSVTHEWLENGAGVAFFGTARWCDDRGQTHLCPNGKHVESYLPLTAGPHTLADHSFAAVKKEVLLALMGEEPELTVDDGEGNQVPVVALSPTVKLNANIRHAAKTIQAMNDSADPFALLS